MKRLHVVGLGCVLTSVAIAAACGFPSPELIDVPADALADTSVPPSDGPRDFPDGFSGPDARFDGPTPEAAPFDGSVPALDAQVLDGDATVVIDGSVVNCDEDNDRFASMGNPCGGFDCNDKNATVRPNQLFNASIALPGDGSAGTLGDWNCNGTVEREFDVNISASCPSLIGLGCAREGWEGVPACGSTARFVKCIPAFLGCTSSVEMRTVSCK